MAKVIQIDSCGGKLLFVKAIKETIHCDLLTAKNTADSITVKGSKFCLNDGSVINESQWDEIVDKCDKMNAALKWHYVNG